MEAEQQTRRQFCRQCSSAGLAALGGAVLGACGGGSPTSSSGINAPALPRVTGTSGGGGVQVTIDAASPLASPGSAADASYVCPCHGSRFDTSGRVLNGPVSRSLRQYQTQFANGVLTITA